MNTRTIAVSLRGSKEEVFSYLSKVENLPQWATEFCRNLKIADGKYKVITCDPSAGELFFRIESDFRTGVVDMMAGPSEDRMAVFPARVLNMPEGSVFIFTMFQIPGITAEKFEEQYRSFLIEAENLRRIFA